MIDFEALFLELYADKAADQDQAALGLLSSPSRSSPTTTTSASSSSSAVSPSSSSSSPSDNPSKKRRRSRRRRRRGRRAAQEGDRYRAEGETSDQPVIKEEEEARDNMGLKLSKYIQKATATNGAAGGQKSNCCDHVSMMLEVERLKQELVMNFFIGMIYCLTFHA